MHPALDALIAELPDGVVVTDPDILASYRHDRAADPAAGTPLAVVRPTRTEQVQAVLRWATAHRVPVVPRGAGTGLSGGATAVDGGIVLSTEKMRESYKAVSHSRCSSEKDSSPAVASFILSWRASTVPS